VGDPPSFPGKQFVQSVAEVGDGFSDVRGTWAGSSRAIPPVIRASRFGNRSDAASLAPEFAPPAVFRLWLTNLFLHLRSLGIAP